MAISTFRIKYNCLPGDCENATDYFSDAVNGNGDGMILEINNMADPTMNVYESSNLWNHLASAKLISGNHPPILQAVGYDINNPPPTIGYATAMTNVYIHVLYSSPDHDLTPNFTQGNFISLHLGPAPSLTGFNFLSMLHNNWQSAPGLSPSDAQFIDQKIDDGLPMSGNVVIPLTTGDTKSCAMVDGTQQGSNIYSTDTLVDWVGECGLWMGLQ